MLIGSSMDVPAKASKNYGAMATNVIGATISVVTILAVVGTVVTALLVSFAFPFLWSILVACICTAILAVIIFQSIDTGKTPDAGVPTNAKEARTCIHSLEKMGQHMKLANVLGKLAKKINVKLKKKDITELCQAIQAIVQCRNANQGQIKTLGELQIAQNNNLSKKSCSFFSLHDRIVPVFIAALFLIPNSRIIVEKISPSHWIKLNEFCRNSKISQKTISTPCPAPQTATNSPTVNKIAASPIHKIRTTTGTNARDSASGIPLPEWAKRSFKQKIKSHNLHPPDEHSDVSSMELCQSTSSEDATISVERRREITAQSENEPLTLPHSASHMRRHHSIATLKEKNFCPPGRSNSTVSDSSQIHVFRICQIPDNSNFVHATFGNESYAICNYGDSDSNSTDEYSRFLEQEKVATKDVFIGHYNGGRLLLNLLPYTKNKTQNSQGPKPPTLLPSSQSSGSPSLSLNAQGSKPSTLPPSSQSSGPPSLSLNSQSSNSSTMPSNLQSPDSSIPSLGSQASHPS